MKRAIWTALLAMPLMMNATKNPITSSDQAEIIPRTQIVNFNSSEQQRLAQNARWQNFKTDHANWNAAFNEMNGLPHRAYGTAIPVAGESLEAKAINFIQNELVDFNIPTEELFLVSTPTTSKHQYANYKQFHQGLEVVNSRMMLKFHANGIVAYGCDVYPNLDLNTTPTVDENTAMTNALNGIQIEILDFQIGSEMKILVLPEAGQTVHLCYEVYVNAVGIDMVPSRYKCLVDAHSGQLISRIDEVKSINKCPKCKKGKEVLTMGMPDVDMHVSAEVYTSSVIAPTSTE